MSKMEMVDLWVEVFDQDGNHMTGGMLDLKPAMRDNHVHMVAVGDCEVLQSGFPSRLKLSALTGDLQSRLLADAVLDEEAKVKGENFHIQLVLSYHPQK